jgi:hypothetical protein
MEVIEGLQAEVNSLQAHLERVEDVMVVDESGSDSGSESTDVDPVKNIVVIPIPPPIIHHLVPIEDMLMEFIPPVLCDPNPLVVVEQVQEDEDPIPVYVEDHQDNPVHGGVPKSWAGDYE